ncbi:MAG: hypothetical protein AVDCRST_MAG08-969 [uncultured Acetobacteraceae bacterium]|uniref:Uncharacterized protein n=1 Tax=uncultured Acetobacteraceae bacterium TaxID=169975 RepID=A0A6J4HMY1_9PROT|nr:MAG: hypothetical protein AVDCRST_MAG08-969 [uncultured Acetobacteraceae bacterium]
MAKTCDAPPRNGSPFASGPRPAPAAPRGGGRAAGTLRGLGAAALLAGSGWPALAAPHCVREPERTAFDIRAVQSQLMVVALLCERQDDYNAFVQRHQPSLLRAYQEVTAHFRRLHGPAEGEQRRDRHVTELANAQSQEGTRHGPAFCRNTEPLVRRALAAQNAGEVARLTATADVTTVHYPLEACAPPTTAAAARAAPLPPPPPREAAIERDPRDEEVASLQAKLDRLERLLERQAAPAVRRVATTRPALTPAK